MMEARLQELADRLDNLEKALALQDRLADPNTPINDRFFERVKLANFGLSSAIGEVRQAWRESRDDLLGSINGPGPCDCEECTAERNRAI